MLLTTFDIVARGGHGGPHLLFPFLLLLLGGGVAAWLLWGRGKHGGQQSALQVLQDRFARGEIDQHEFTYRRDVLLGKRTVSDPPKTSASERSASEPNPYSSDPDDSL